MEILLFGGSGQLGSDIISRCSDLRFKIVSPVISEVDIIDRDQVLYLAHKLKPQLIINSAAYTNVDGAEENSKEAFAINRDGATNIAEAANEIGAKLIHISTDYVFNGSKHSPYSEDEETCPLGAYGQSKFEGEQAVLNSCPKSSLVVRTAWLHGRRGPNFVQTMLRLFKERESIRVVNDQIGSPTWSGWLAEALLDLGRLMCTPSNSVSGVLHATCAGSVSWYDFTVEILNMIKKSEKDLAIKSIEPVSTEQFGAKAPRPPYSVLDCSKLQGIIGRAPITWRVGLKGHLNELGYLEID